MEKQLWYANENGNGAGWNKDNESIQFLLEICDEFQKVNYEIRNCNRGLYGDFGTTPYDLKYQLEDLKSKLTDLIEMMPD